MNPGIVLGDNPYMPEYLKSQPTFPVAWSVLSSCPYIEMLSESWRAWKDEIGTYIFAVPLGNGASPMIHLHDLGLYARWIFDRPEESSGFNLEVATAHVALEGLVQTFQKVTGKTVTAVRVTPEEYFAGSYECIDPNHKLGRVVYLIQPIHSKGYGVVIVWSLFSPALKSRASTGPLINGQQSLGERL